jgi:hypothetical protein
MTSEPGRNLAIRVTWLDEERRPQYPLNPAYPNGIEVDCSDGAKVTCTQSLPYPAKGCGQYLLVCETCGLKIIVTATGREDDPRSVKVACKKQKAFRN